MPLTTAVTVLLVTAVHAVGILVTAPAEGNAVAIFALELISVTFHVTAILKQTKKETKTQNCFHCSMQSKAKSSVRRKSTGDTSSEPSAQSWSPSHFQRPAMQRPFVQENSLSEHSRGTEDTSKSA